jgi:hypothetical protein
MENLIKINKSEMKLIFGGVESIIGEEGDKCLDECQANNNCNNGYTCQTVKFEASGRSCLRCMLPL